MPDEPWMEVCDIVQEKGITTISMEKKCKTGKWLSEEALQIAVKRTEVKSKGEKERYILHWKADSLPLSHLGSPLVKLLMAFFHSTRTKNFTICMEHKKTSNSKSNLEKKKQNGCLGRPYKWL